MSPLHTPTPDPAEPAPSADPGDPADTADTADTADAADAADAAPVDAATLATLAALVQREAELIDSARWDEWLALYAEDGRYWVPLKGAAQTEDEPHNALADEDRLLLQLRVARLRHPAAHALKPMPRCQHVLQASRGVAAGAGTVTLRTPMHYVELQGERRLALSGTLWHRWQRQADGRWRIALKRVDLLEAGTALPMLQLFP